MKRAAKSITAVFAAGVLGGLTSSLAMWLCGLWGIPHALGVKIAPHLSGAWLYPRLVWGGVWGLLFLLPLLRHRVLSSGVLLSLVPTFVQLFVLFPYKTSHGVMGLELGLLTPLLVLGFNAVWGVTTAWWIRYVR